MILYTYLVLVAIATLIAIWRWRWGLYLCVLAGVLEDPIRKLTPGTPAWLTLTSVPIYLGASLGAVPEITRKWKEFRNFYPALVRAAAFFLVSLVPAAAISATYGSGSWQLTLIGLFSYGSAMLSVLMGYVHPARIAGFRVLLQFYCLSTAVILLGVPFDYLGITDPWHLLGTSALHTDWVRSEPGYKIPLVSGLYRSPDIMGWHAATAAMTAVAIAAVQDGLGRWSWAGCAAWCGVCATLSGRRKAFWMLPAFILFLMSAMFLARKLKARHAALLLLLCISIVTGYTLYTEIGRSEDIERYYFSDRGRIAERIGTPTITTVIITFRQSGFWGEGIGVATTGGHRVKGARPRVWQEDGLSRLLLELGVPGFLCALVLALTVMSVILRLVRMMHGHERTAPLFWGLAAMLGAHACGFIVSHQVYGTPFVGLFFPMFIGFLLSARRVYPGQEEDEEEIIREIR